MQVKMHVKPWHILKICYKDIACPEVCGPQCRLRNLWSQYMWCIIYGNIRVHCRDNVLSLTIENFPEVTTWIQQLQQIFKIIILLPFYHLPGLFEFYELYRIFLPLFRKHRKYFYDWCEIGSIYGAPSDCIWGGGRTSFGYSDPEDVLDLVREYGISARLTFSNSLLREEHLTDKKCNELCKMFEHASDADNSPHTHQLQNGVIVHSELLLNYLQKNILISTLSLQPQKLLTDFLGFFNLK